MRDNKVLLKLIRRLSLEAVRSAELENGDAHREKFLVIVRAVLLGELQARVGRSEIEEILHNLIGITIPGDDLVETALPRELFQDITALGWAYQVWNRPIRDSSSWAISRRGKEQRERVDVASVTQVFTDAYIAHFLCRRGISLWNERKASSQKLPKICDPAIGTGHMIHAAVHALVEQKIAVEQIPDLIFGYDIDPIAVIISRAVVFCEMLRRGFSEDPIVMSSKLYASIQAIEESEGSLNRECAQVNANKPFDIIVTNPPYLGRRKLPRELQLFLDSAYPAASVDLCAAFLQRCVELLSSEGALCVITSDKWLRLRQYAPLRKGDESFSGFLRLLTIAEIYELGERSFDSGSDLHDGMRASLLIASRRAPDRDHKVVYASLSQIRSYSEKVQALQVCSSALPDKFQSQRVSQEELLNGGNVFLKVGGLPEQVSSLPRELQDVGNVVVGIQTNDDARFVRYIWEVPGDAHGWKLHCKGGGYARWAGLNRWAIKWEGVADTFFAGTVSRKRSEHWIERGGWVYSWFANGHLGVRRKYEGWSFGRAAAGGVFVDDDRFIAILNSRIASSVVQSIGGKIQLPEGTVKKIPLPNDISSINSDLISMAVRLKEILVANSPTEALCAPSAMRPLWELMLAEALLLVVEGILEEQVELAMDLTPAVRRELLSRVGVVAGWYQSSVSISSHPIQRHYHGEMAKIYQRCSEVIPTIEVASGQLPTKDKLCRLEWADLGAFLGNARWLFPSSGIIETCCRVFCLHPFDAVGVLQNVMMHPSTIRDKVYGEYLGRRLVVDLLTRLGHQWWFAPGEPSCSKESKLSIDAMCDLLKHHASDLEFGAEWLSSVRDWIGDVFVSLQDKLFFNRSPLVFERDGRQSLSVSRRSSVNS